MARAAQKGFLNTVRELVVLLLIVFLIRTFGFGLYQVPTGSMETTMLIGERFFSDKFTILFSKPKRSSIIALNDPLFPYSDSPVLRLFQEYVWGPSNWTKRVIGIPGDHVRGVIEDGKPVVYLNDKKLDEPYLNKYPLLALWKENPKKLEQDAQQEAYYLVASHQLPEEKVSVFVDYVMQGNRDWRPYDARYPFSEQPFYRMHADRVVNDPQGSKPGITVTPEGMLMREPGVALPGPGERIASGKGYYTGTDDFDIYLGEDEYWLMGDNRRGSTDSRFFGPVKERLIHGKILFRIWSVDSTESWWIVDLIKHPIDFWSRMRWSRFFQVMN